jgi:hypothetical protein
MRTQSPFHPLVRTLGLLAFFVGFVGLCWEELFKNPQATGFGDYQFFHHSWEAARVAWYGEGQAPLWNPFQCGGIPDWADPQAQFFHPLYALTGPLGTTLALKVFLYLHAVFGCFGMYYLAKRQGLRWFGALAAATTWIGSGFFAWHCGTGHGNFIAFYLAPWALLLWRRAVADVRFAPLLALVLSAAVYAGGAYAFPFFVLLLAVEATLQLLHPAETETRSGVLVAGSVTVLLTLTLCALRLLPILEHLAYYPRTVGGKDSIALSELLQMLTRNDIRTPGTRFGGHPWVWSEYGSYIGPLALGLGSIGALRALALRLHGRVLIGALVFVALTLGHAGLLSPWTLLHQLPVYDSLRVPTRFVVLFLLFFSLLVGSALDAIRAHVPHRFGRYGAANGPLSWLRIALPWGCLLWIAVSLVEHHRFVLDGMWQDKAVQASKRAPRFFLAALPKPHEPWMQHPAPSQFPSANVGTGYCYTGMAYRPAPGLWAGPVAQARVSDGAVESWGNTSQSFWAVVALPVPGRVIFNQTYSPGWHADTGELTLSRGRVAVDLPPGRHRVEIVYRPVLYPWAVGLSGLGVLFAALVGLFGERFRRLSGKATLTLGCLALAMLTSLAYARAPKWAYQAQTPAKFQPEN